MGFINEPTTHTRKDWGCSLYSSSQYYYAGGVNGRGPQSLKTAHGHGPFCIQ